MRISLLARIGWRKSTAARIAEEQWRRTKHLKIDENTCRGILGVRIVIGREAQKMRIKIAAANSVVFTECEPLLHHTFSGKMVETKLPIFPQCRIIFLYQCDPEFNAKLITAQAFPKLTHIYCHGSMGSAAPGIGFPDSVQWVMTRGSPEFMGVHSRITYADFNHCMRMAASPSERRSQSRASSDSDVTDTIKKWGQWIGMNQHATRGARRWSRATRRRQSRMSRSGSDWSLCPADFLVT